MNYVNNSGDAGVIVHFVQHCSRDVERIFGGAGWVWWTCSCCSPSLPSVQSLEPSKRPIESAYESSGTSQQGWQIGRPHRVVNGVETAPTKSMPLYWKNAQGELRRMRHDRNRDYYAYDDHHR